MFKTRILLLIFFLLLSITWISSSGIWKRYKASIAPKTIVHHTQNPALPEKLKAQASLAKEYNAKHHFNEQTCFLIDMGLPSGTNRFFVYDLQKDSVLNAGLVAHGNCYQRWLEGRRYSNQVESGCTSLGRYKVGTSYTGKFGLSYKIYGLDSSNSNAYKRTVVLHSHSCVPDTEVEEDICQSNGCPTVSPAFLNLLTPVIRKSGKPVLLWIYE